VLFCPIARRKVALNTITPQWHSIRPILPPLRPPHPVQSPDAAPHYLYFASIDAPSLLNTHGGHPQPHDDRNEEERTANPQTNAAAHAPQTSSSEDVHFQCRLLLPGGARCTEMFYVAPNFSRSSPYAHHLAQAHLIKLSACKTTGPWVCTLDGCRSRKATTVGVFDPLTHIRTHLDHHVECTDCYTPFSRISSLKRHRSRYCGSASGKEPVRKRARTLLRRFDCPDCGRSLGSAEALSHHQILQECVAGPSG
jgi:hypothetical protein